MQLEEFYEAIGGNYQEVKRRIPSDSAIQRFVIKFLDDKSYETLREAVEKRDYEEAYKAVHTLKGVSQNLGSKRLGTSAAELSSFLRNANADEIDEEHYQELRQQVFKDYEDVAKAIRDLQG